MPLDIYLCTLDEIIAERNRVQLIVENIDGLTDLDKQNFFTGVLGVVNRTIERVTAKVMSCTPWLIKEVNASIADAEAKANQLKNQFTGLNAVKAKPNTRWILEFKESTENRMRSTKQLVLHREDTGKRIAFGQFLSEHSKEALIKLLEEFSIPERIAAKPVK